MQGITNRWNGHRIKKTLLNNVVYIFGIVTLIVLSLSSPYFLTSKNLLSILRSSSTMMVVGTGLTFALLVGQLDLSVGANLRFCASIAAILVVKRGWNPYIGMLLMLVLGVCVGAVNGILVTKVKLNAWLVTLAMKLVLVGIVVLLTKTIAINMPKDITQFRTIKILGLPVFVFVLFLLVVVMQLILKYTTFGRNIVAVGSNKAAARKLGINVEKYTFYAFLICGLFCGIGANIISINLGSITRELGDGYEFTAVTAIVLGGVSLAGGKGSVFPSAFAGVMIVTMLENGLSILGVDPYYFQLIRALIIFVMMYLDSIKNKV